MYNDYEEGFTTPENELLLNLSKLTVNESRVTEP